MPVVLGEPCDFDVDSFQIKPFKEIKKMPLDDIINYYRELRLYEYLKGVTIEGVKLRKLIHPLLLAGIFVDRLANKEKLKVIGNDRVKTNRPKIYACTHIGGNDIQRVFEAIKSHAYLLLGDPKEAYIDFNGKMLDLNGVIPFETHDTIDRHISYYRSVEALLNNADVLLFPEGTWNMSENLLVLPLFPGAARMANDAKADIIPVAIEQYGNQFYAKIGRNIFYDPDKSQDIEAVKKELRDAMAALKYEIFLHKCGENYTNRDSIPEDYGETFVKTIVDRCEYDFSLEEMLGDMYRDKNITPPEEALIVTPKEMFEKRKILTRGYTNIIHK